MKFFAMIVALAAATFAAAAPTTPSPKDARAVDITSLAPLNGVGSFNLAQLNNFRFVNSDLAYIWGLQRFDVNLIAQLAAHQNLQIGAVLAPIFVQQQIDLGSLLALVELKTVLHFAQIGVLNGFDLSGLHLSGAGILDFGILGGAFAGLDFNSFLDPNVIRQAQAIAIKDFGSFVH